MSDVNVASGVNIRLLTVRNRVITATQVLANTETILSIPFGTKRYSIKTRGNSDLRIAFNTNQVTLSTGNYLTYWAGSVYEETNLDPNTPNFNVYIALSQADTVELVIYS
jgi:hypothetical protein